LQPFSISRSTLVIALLVTGLFLAGSWAQAPQDPQSGPEKPSASPRAFPAPTNLQVLPKNLSGQQVNDIMEQWAHSLGVRCDSCHTEDLDAVNSEGRPRLRFANDSKPMKTLEHPRLQHQRYFSALYSGNGRALKGQTEIPKCASSSAGQHCLHAALSS